MNNLNSIVNLQGVLELLLAISLSAAAGFRVFLPLFVLSVAAVYGHIDLPSDLDWVESSPALVVFGVAALLEIGGYYLPWFDHFLDILSTPAAIIVGTALAASVTPELNPVAQWTLALVAGGGTAGLTKGVMNLLRATSTATSGGLTNPVLSTLEWLLATGLSVLAIAAPLLAGILVISFGLFAIYKFWQFFRRSSPPPSTQEPT
ncbi:MAG: DUF4126 domain-containing protein [Chloroflexaceae bacterium]|nr:DUF4126 domain-containing protein [Chloroflexaceae bacterium]